MSDNDLASKLTKGMRRAKQPAAKEVAGGAIAASSSVVREAALGTEDSSASARSNSTAPRPGAKRFAEQDDQAPPASLDSPWKNLHPKRIWPD